MLTNATDVKVIINTSLEDIEINSFINIADGIINQQLDSDDFTDAELKEIERWLTAHLIATTRERIGTSEKVGDASITYAGKFGEGLKSTPYGQMVLQLDTSGVFADLGTQKLYFKAITSFDD